jgi:hypothetical protein
MSRKSPIAESPELSDLGGVRGSVAGGRDEAP